MNKDIILRAKDLLLDLSIVHSCDINDRIGWVLSNAGANWLIERELVCSPDSIVSVQPFIVVSSTPVNGVIGFRTGKRHIHGISLYDNIDAASEGIEYYLLEDPMGPFTEVDLFVYNGHYFEKTPYNIGVYENVSGAAGYHCYLDDLDETFNMDSDIRKTLFDSPLSDAQLEENEGKKIFVEIPHLWEVWEKTPDEGYGHSEYYFYKNLKTIIEEAAVTLYEGEAEEVSAENSWYKITISVDKSVFDIDSNECDKCEEIYDCFKSALVLDIKLKY